MLIKKIFTLLMFAATISTAANAQNIIRTVSEFGTVSKPESIATDASGNLYIVERFAGRVRKVDFVTDVVTTLVTGLSGPRGIAFDENGNFFISSQHQISKYSSSGTLIGVVAGSATAGYSGDGGAATAASLNTPYGIAYDKINKYLYIAEQSSNVIRKIDFSVPTPIISTFAGTQGINTNALVTNSATSSTFRQPAAVAIDALGNVYWSGLLVYAVFKSNIAGNNVSLVVGSTFFASGNNTTTEENTGSGIDAASGTAKIGAVGAGGLTFDALGNLYVSDAANHRIRKVETTGTIGVFSKIRPYAGFTNFVSGTTTVASGGDNGDAIVTTGTSTIMNAPYGIAFNPTGTVLFIAENNGILIRAVGTAAALNTTLPLDLTSFEAKAVNETAELKWTTENEVNFKEFVIERKGDNDATFTAIKTIPTKNLSGKTAYNFTDANPLKGNNYYQLKMVDNDGTFELSEVKAVKFASLSLTKINVYPNPVQNTLNLNHEPAGKKALISIYSLDGKLAISKNIDENATQTTFDVSYLINGQYILEFNNDGNRQIVKFIK